MTTTEDTKIIRAVEDVILNFVQKNETYLFSINFSGERIACTNGIRAETPIVSRSAPNKIAKKIKTKPVFCFLLKICHVSEKI